MSKRSRSLPRRLRPTAALNQGGLGKTGGAAAQAAFGAAESIITDQPVFTADEATALANGLSNDISRDFFQAEGTCTGDPRVKAGYKVTIKGVGTRFSGKYFVTSATHIYNANGYETRFSISGRQPQHAEPFAGVACRRRAGPDAWCGRRVGDQQQRPR